MRFVLVHQVRAVELLFMFADKCVTVFLTEHWIILCHLGIVRFYLTFSDLNQYITLCE